MRNSVSRGLSIQIIYLEPNGRSVGEMNPEGLRVAITVAKTEWVLLAKLDTLPWREGHENWLSEAMRAVEHYNCLGLTGSAHNYYNLYQFPKFLLHIEPLK